MTFRVLFIYPNFRSSSLIPPGVTLLSRILKNHGIEVELFDTTDYALDEGKDYERLAQKSLGIQSAEFRELKHAERDPWADLNDKISSFGPNLIAMSCTESTFLLGIEIIQHISHRDPRDMPVLLGGSFATFAPARALDFPEIDIVCVGEGEYPLLELCQRMDQKKPYLDIAGLAFRDRFGKFHQNPLPPAINLDDNPTDFDLGLFEPERLLRPMDGKYYRMAPVETIRGCVFHCTFCNSRNTGGRKKSMGKVHEELLFYRDHHRVEYAFFWADTFLMMSKRELDEFCEMYQDVGLPFWVQTHVKTITDWRLKKLKDIGLHHIAVGIENGHEKFRREVILKDFSNDEAVEAAQILADLGIIYNTNNMVGYPGETREIAMETVELNRRFPNVHTTNCFSFTPYYGTPARVEAVEAGFMDPDVIAPGNAEDSILSMSQFTPEEVRGLQRTFALYVKFPKSRWPEIKQAEAETEEGRALLEKLQIEFSETFFGESKIAF